MARKKKKKSGHSFTQSEIRRAMRGGTKSVRVRAGAEGDLREVSLPLPLHDLFFKGSVQNEPRFVRPVMKLVLTAEEYKKFDWSKVTVAQENLTDDHGKEVRADLVCTVPLKTGVKVSKSNAKLVKAFKFVILIEHKSKNALRVCEQLAKMVIPLLMRDNVLVLPVVVYHGKTRWTAPRSLHDLLKQTNPLFREPFIYDDFAKNVPNFEYRLLDLNKMREDDPILRSLTYEAFVYTLKMIWAFEKAPQSVLSEMLARAEKMPRSSHKVFMRHLTMYLQGRYPRLFTREVLVKAAAKAKAKKTQDWTQTLYEAVARQEYNFGVSDGIEKGVEKGRQEMVILMLKKAGVKEVARLTGLSTQKIQKLKKAS